ncbi:uncharacterized protein LOC121390466 [Gigantopelta aegis]|uniref:uncharacterized protein LOC121390466 n=1 Tax=Gigantopelta aegis TaxID=1735272 RepID=UPI001B88A43C|nr:uncharacterized protein LOC121390466 [Gigantopelta aegis]
MCSNEVIAGVKGLFLDAFVPASSTTTCSCSVRATQPLWIGFTQVLTPNKKCNSTLSVRERIQKSLYYTCKNGDNTTNVESYRKEYNDGIFINLQTTSSSQDVTHCMVLRILLSPGLIISSATSSTTSSTKDSTTSFTIRQTSTSTIRPGISSISSTRPERSSSGLVSTSVSLPTVSTQKTNSPSYLPAAVGGAVGAGLVVAVVAVVFIYIYIRKKGTEGKENTDGGTHVNRVSNPYIGAANINPYNNVNRHNNVDIAGNTYEHLQHNTVQYNTDHNAGNTYEYLQHNTVQYNTDHNDGNTYEHLQHNTVQYNTDGNTYEHLQHNTVQYNADHNAGNTYEHLQHNTVHYVNTSSSVDEDHVYLHVNEPT